MECTSVVLPEVFRNNCWFFFNFIWEWWCTGWWRA